MPVPAQPKIYHIVHIDKLASIIAGGALLSDAKVNEQKVEGTTIGMSGIKQRRLTTSLSSHPGLCVGHCVPFYFCPRSIMLYVIYQANHPELNYRGGQQPIVHLQADLHATVQWATRQQHRWAFTLSNAGSYYFEDRNDLASLNELNWAAINTDDWQQYKDGKQAEFLLEDTFPWSLIEKIGVYSRTQYQRAADILQQSAHKPTIEIIRSWYY